MIHTEITKKALMLSFEAYIIKRKSAMKLKYIKTIEFYQNISYLFWCGLLMVSTIILMIALGVMDASMIAVTVGLLVYSALDIVTAACATTKH